MRIYRPHDLRQFLDANPKPTPSQVMKHLRDFNVNAKGFDVTYDKIELEIIAKWEDTSFGHAFGTQRQGYWDIEHIFYNDTMLPLALISDETIQKIIDKINEE